MLAAGDAAAPPGLAAELKALADRYLDAYRAHFVEGFRRGENTVFSRQIAFVIMAAATLLRATGEDRYRRDLAALVEVLLQFEQPLQDAERRPDSGFLMGVRSSRDIHVDCHSAALLALSACRAWLPDAGIAAAIDRGIEAFALVTGRSNGWARCGRSTRSASAGPTMAGQPRLSHAFWNFHVGLTLRLFRALQELTRCRVAGAVYAKHAESAWRCIEPLLLRQVALGTRQHEDGGRSAVPGCPRETNSETQPWVRARPAGHPWD